MLILKTERLALKLLTIHDIPSLLALSREPALVEFTQCLSTPYHIQSGKRWLNQKLKAYQQGKELMLGIFNLADNHFMGCINLANISSFHKRAELGYWLGLPYWKKGYASEAVHCLTEYAFDVLKLNRIEARTLSNNQNSINLLKRSGFKLEGELKQALYFKDKFVNITLLALLAEAKKTAL